MPNIKLDCECFGGVHGGRLKTAATWESERKPMNHPFFSVCRKLKTFVQWDTGVEEKLSVEQIWLLLAWCKINGNVVRRKQHNKKHACENWMGRGAAEGNESSWLRPRMMKWKIDIFYVIVFHWWKLAGWKKTHASSRRKIAYIH